ncbi:ABC transporter permease [Pseudomonas brassicacearum]|uniref:ABC transporter permease n=1 Tax=Pseudomonas brassicacearum TaxID=930166 RepID=UPI00332425AB
MAKYIAQRLIVMFFILLGVLTITFVLSRALPGSPVEMMLGNHPTAEQIAVAREKLGLDKPLPIQYFNYIGDLLQGDFGTSLRTGRPVAEEVIRRVGATFELTFLAMFWVVLLGVPIGVISAAPAELSGRQRGTSGVHRRDGISRFHLGHGVAVAVLRQAQLVAPARTYRCFHSSR